MHEMNDFGGIAARQNSGPLWKFTPRNDGSFTAPYAEFISRLYFPLMNMHGMKSSVTPELKGDIVSTFQTFLTPATGTEELHRNVSGRNFWIKMPDQNPWSVSGNSAFQKAAKWTDIKDESEIEGQIGAFIVRRRNEVLGLESEVTVFVPDSNDYVELMRVRITNISGSTLAYTPTYAIPVFGRHADNFRDHRQVTSMFQKTYVEEHGVRVKPTIVHDEHGHRVNHVQYAVLGFEANGAPPQEKWPVMKDFIGEGGSLDNPEAVFRSLPAPAYPDGSTHGKEAIAAMRFGETTLEPGQSAEYIIIHGITADENDLRTWKEKFGDSGLFELNLTRTSQFWHTLASAVSFETGNKTFDNWTRWITFQLKCRQIFGNSYLPDFGYGRGGRGWRDLWQDLLSIFLIDPVSAREEILNNFLGIRVDGSNATIIGTRPGEFIADRNNVPRTWSDHGAWPVFVVDFYIQQTGDSEILFTELPYWKDAFSHRCKARDHSWDPSDGYRQLDESGEIYQGTVLEHMLLQQLTAFFNVGENNNLLLEGGDWNDTLDMAREKGESVCFHNFYRRNLVVIADLLEHLHRLDRYFQRVQQDVSGSKAQVDIRDLLGDLREKSEHILKHIRENEWINTSDGFGFFNGHYDNDGLAIHGDSDDGVLMDLTSQVMPVMCGVASDEQVKEICRSANFYLKDPDSPGLRLCTEFKSLNLNIGRITGFTYGYKEHGSKWSQQNIMFMHGLYMRGFAAEGLELFRDIFNLSNNSSKALIFPGIPSYFEPGDRGAYAYLTGSSAWLLLTLTTQIFGVDGRYGDLMLNPKLHEEFFDEQGRASMERYFRDLRLRITYHNPERLNYPEYKIETLSLNGTPQDFVVREGDPVVIPYTALVKNSTEGICNIEITLK